MTSGPTSSFGEKDMNLVAMRKKCFPFGAMIGQNLELFHAGIIKIPFAFCFSNCLTTGMISPGGGQANTSPSELQSKEKAFADTLDPVEGKRVA
jgi:hypothetical protein